MQIPIVIHKDNGGIYGVTVPDIAGCHSAGDTIDDAIANAKEAILAQLLAMLDRDRSPNISVSSIEELQKKEEYANATWGLVDVDLTALDKTPERVNISLPRSLLRRIDNHVEAKHETRSGFLARAAINELARDQGKS